MLKQILSILILSFLILPTTSHAFTGKVISVADGDTVTVLKSDLSKVKVRLYGIDCPEKAQDFGSKAKQFTASLVFGKQVDVEAINQDRYGRTVGVISVDGVNVNEAILRAGYAWVYTRSCRKAFCSDWQKTQEQAQENRVGL